MRFAALALVAACAAPQRPLSNATGEHRAAVELGDLHLSVAVPPGVMVYRTSRLLWSADEVETAEIDLHPPIASAGILIAPVSRAFTVDRLAYERRVVGRRSTPVSAELALVEDGPNAMRIRSLVIHRKDLGVVCEARSYTDAGDLEVAVQICRSLR